MLETTIAEQDNIIGDRVAPAGLLTSEKRFLEVVHRMQGRRHLPLPLPSGGSCDIQVSNEDPEDSPHRSGENGLIVLKR
jgi:hypothetical protein